MNFVGRDAEVGILSDAATAAASGAGAHVVHVIGPAGVGKSALLEAWMPSLDGWVVATAFGDDAEMALPFGVVDQIVRSLPPSDEVTRHRLAARDAPTIGGGLLACLEPGEEATGVAVVVDDAHWADPDSLRALAFAVRRLRRDPVLLVVASRPGDRSTRLPVDQLVESLRGAVISLGGLDRAETAALLAQLGVAAPDQRGVERLRSHTDGNPLHLRAIIAEHGADALGAAGHPLPAPKEYAASVVRRLESCTPPGRAVVEAASVLGQRVELSDLAAVTEVGDLAAAVDEAVGAGLLALMPLDRQHLRFSHPLVRASVYHSLGLRLRVTLHQRASLIADEPISALRHRVACEVGPDEGLETECAAVGSQEVRAGRWAAACEAYHAAAQFAGSAERAQLWQLEAIDYALAAGDVADATTSWAALPAPGAAPPAAWHYVAGRIAVVAGRTDEARGHLVGALQACGANDPTLCARISSQLAQVDLNEGRAAAAVRWAEAALEAEPDQGVIPMPPRGSLVFALAILGRRDDALDVIEGATSSGGVMAVDDLIGRGVAALWIGELEAAAADLGRAGTSPGGSVYDRILALMYLGEAEFRLGRWDDAITHSELAASLAEDSSHTWMLPLAHATASAPLAGRGAFADAEAHLVAARRGSMSVLAAKVFVACGAARLAHARGDFARVIAEVAPLKPLYALDGVLGLHVQPWQPLAIDAFAAQGRVDDAKALLVALEAVAERTPVASLSLARARAVVGAGTGMGAEAEVGLEEALGSPGEAAPLDRALAEMWLGARWRRSRRRASARDVLTSALHHLTVVGATPYIERCEREMAACGLSPRRRHDNLRDSLTPQEVSVANLAAAGMSNREIASELFLSVKTVEYHLSNVFRKLAIPSRSRLASEWNQELRGFP